LGATVLRTDLGAALLAGFLVRADADFAFAATFLPAVTFLLAGLTDAARFAFGREEAGLATRFAVFADARHVGGDDRPIRDATLRSGDGIRLRRVHDRTRDGPDPRGNVRASRSHDQGSR